MASSGITRISRWEEIPEFLRERLLDEVTKEVVSLAAQMQEGSALIGSDPYGLFIWDCAKALRKKMTDGDS